jgi:hypothetical protein
MAHLSPIPPANFATQPKRVGNGISGATGDFVPRRTRDAVADRYLVMRLVAVEYASALMLPRRAMGRFGVYVVGVEAPFPHFSIVPSFLRA